MKKIVTWFKKQFSTERKAQFQALFRKERLKSAGIDMAFLLAACCVGAFSTVSVLIPNGLTSGGLTGVVRIVQQYINLDFSMLFYGGSLLILASVLIFLGFREFRKILLLTLLFPAVLFLFEKLDIRLLESKDILLAAVFCGVFSGICVGLVFWRGYSFSGTDAIAKILQKKLFPHYSLSKILLVIDGIIIILSALIFGRNIALYALITQVILTKTTEVVIYGFEAKIVRLEILTSQTESVKDYVINNVGRGLSSMRIVGEYTKKQHTQLTVLCSPRESILIKKQVAKLDSGALLTVLPVETVWGEGKGFNHLDKE